MTEEEILKNAGESTSRALDIIFDSEYQILDENEELSGNYLLESPDFKSFGTGLTELLVKKGYDGGTDDNKAKYKYFHDKCKEGGISLTPSVVKSWFEDTRPVSSARSRENVFKICFALGCTLDETIDFFNKVYFECPFNFRVYQETIYYYCLKNSLGYDKANELINQAEVIFNDADAVSAELLYTHTRKIGNAVDSITTDDELLSYISQHKNEFIAANKTAYNYAETLIKENTQLAVDIYETEYSYDDTRKTKRENNIDLFLFILFDFDMHSENKERSFAKDSDLPELVSSNFISKENLSRILSRKKLSYDALRKNLIILEFFNYFANLKLESIKNKEDFCSFEDDFYSFLDEVGDLLNTCGYPPLYARNPFDWLIMHCANTAADPLTEFKNSIQAYYLD